MSLLLPLFEVTECSRAVVLVSKYPQNIVGTFWVMDGSGFENAIPNWWVDIVLEDNQAQSILDVYDEKNVFSSQRQSAPDIGFCIVVTADRANPANVSYVIQRIRMINIESLRLLTELAMHNIPAHTEVAHFSSFLSKRYDHQSEEIPERLRDINRWDLQTWEDYCSYLMAEHGQNMIREFWAKEGE